VTGWFDVDLLDVKVSLPARKQYN